MKVLKRFILSFVLLALLAASLILYWISSHKTVPILMYHMITAQEKIDPNAVSPENFSKVMQFIKRHDYTVISLEDYIDRKKRGEEIPKKAVVITFDDGTVDNYINAYPILKKFNYPATIFMPYDYIGQEGFLSVEQIKEMADSGLITFGSHTLTHAYLPELTKEKLKAEIFLSKHAIENKTELDIDSISYPAGGFTPEVKQMSAEAGYKAGLTTNRGYDRDNKDLFELKRISMRERDAQQYVFMWAKLSGYYNTLRKTTKPN